jgi:hypothetical protein
MIRKIIFWVSSIITLVAICAATYYDYVVYGHFYHSLIIIGIIVTNINLYIQGQHAKILYTAIKRWLGWK